MLATPIENGAVRAVKSGSAGLPVPGFKVDILDHDGHVLPRGAEGAKAIQLTMPPGCLPTLWQATARFKEGYSEAELISKVRDQLGALACFNKSLVIKRLPKTRSGKILGRVMRHIADDKPYHVPSTIEDLSVLEEIGEICENRSFKQL